VIRDILIKHIVWPIFLNSSVQ